MYRMYKCMFWRGEDSLPWSFIHVHVHVYENNERTLLRVEYVQLNTLCTRDLEMKLCMTNFIGMTPYQVSIISVHTLS